MSDASTATVTNNQICLTGGDAPFRFGSGFFGATMSATVTGNVADPACDAFSGALLPSATLSTDTVLRVVNGISRYSLERLVTWTVPADVTLTLQPAITLDVEGSGGFGLTVDGTLDVDGATVVNADIDFRAGSGGTIGNNSTIIGASPISIADATGIEPTTPTIENSTITATSGTAITVSGFSEPTITGNTIETNSRGISYAETSGGTSRGNTIQFVGTTSDREGIFLSGDASPLVDANVIGDDAARSDIGIELSVSPTSTATVSNNQICVTGGDAPFRFGSGFFGATMSATVTGNVADPACDSISDAILATSTLGADTVIKAIDGISIYTLKGSSQWSVPAAVTLTIEPEVTLNGEKNFTANFLAVDGTLDADGATIGNADIRFQAGAGGFIQNSSILSSDISIAGNLVGNPSTPRFSNNTISATSTAFSISGNAQPTIDGNTITSSSSASTIIVSETAAPVIIGNSIMTNRRGIAYSESAAGIAAGNTIGFVPLGGSGREGIALSGGASPLVDSNIIGDDPDRSDIGIELLVEGTSEATLTGNEICSTGLDLPFRIGPGFFDLVGGATLTTTEHSCDLPVSVRLASGTVSADSIVGPVSGFSFFVLDGDWTVGGGVTLTIQPGITLDIEGASTAELFVDGSLVADGVTFENADIRYRDGSGGVLENSAINGSSNPLISVGGASLTLPATPTIRGNSIFAGNGVRAIAVAGAAQPTIEGNVITTNWRGIEYSGASGGTATGNTIDFLPLGASNRRGLDFLGSASPVVSGNTIGDDPDRDDVGISVSIDGGSAVQILNNEVLCSGSDTPIQIGPGVFADAFSGSLEGNVFSCTGTGGVPLVAGTTTENSTIQPLLGRSTFELRGNLAIASSATLQVPAGITIMGANGLLTVNDCGFLSVEQASFDGAGLVFRSGSDGVISGSTFSDAQIAIELSGTTDVQIDGNLFEGNGTAIDIDAAGSLSSTSGNTFDGNTRALRFGDADALFSAFPVGFDTNVFRGAVGSNRLDLPNRIDVSGTFPPAPVPYHNETTLQITSGAQVTMTAGTVIANSANARWIVEADSRLVAQGTSDFPVIFTSDDPTTASRWSGLEIRGGDSLLENCVIEFSRANGLTLTNAAIEVVNCPHQ